MTMAKLLCFTLLITIVGSTSAEEQKVHQKVQAALDWELPQNDCEEPKIRGVGTGNINEEGVTETYDVDSYQIGRFERKQKRWRSCVSKYKSGLLEEFTELKNSAQYGLTQQQADIILGKMALIQSALRSPNGFPNGFPSQS